MSEEGKVSAFRMFSGCLLGLAHSIKSKEMREKQKGCRTKEKRRQNWKGNKKDVKHAGSRREKMKKTRMAVRVDTIG